MQNTDLVIKNGSFDYSTYGFIREESTLDSALNDRLTALEERTQAILQENLRLQWELDFARARYLKNQQVHELKTLFLCKERAPLEQQISERLPNAAHLREINRSLAHNIVTQTNLRNKFYSIWAAIERAKKY